MQKKTLLVAPLNWGLGHSTRMIPVINELKKSCNVVIAAYGSSYRLLESEFPDIKMIQFTSFDIKYSGNRFLVFSLFLQIPAILYHIIKEHIALQKLIKQYQIDFVVSDNRFGLWSKHCKTVYVTHQIWIKLPKQLTVFEYFAHKLHKMLIEKYDYCWIPDDTYIKLSGSLSHTSQLPHNYIFTGILSRFSNRNCTNSEIESYYDIMCIASGPEPQRSMFVDMLVLQTKNIKQKALIVCGLPGMPTKQLQQNITIVNHLESKEFEKFLRVTPVIVCRSGYSSLMDLVTIGKPAIVVPTPGQSEQEYLAGYVSAKGWFVAEKQYDFNLERAMVKLKHLKCKINKSSMSNLKYAIKELLND